MDDARGREEAREREKADVIHHFLSRRCASLESRSTSALLLSTSLVAVPREADVAVLRSQTASRNRCLTRCGEEEVRASSESPREDEGDWAHRVSPAPPTSPDVLLLEDCRSGKLLRGMHEVVAPNNLVCGRAVGQRSFRHRRRIDAAPSRAVKRDSQLRSSEGEGRRGRAHRPLFSPAARPPGGSRIALPRLPCTRAVATCDAESTRPSG